MWDEIEAALGGQAVRGEPLSRHTTLRIGGPADLFVPAASASALHDLVLLARRLEVPYLVLGAGSNVLVSDAGFRGLVILNKARRFEFQTAQAPAPRVRVESGVILPSLARECIRHGLAGLEWAVGVPGTVGGAVVGNAGAHGGDIAQSLVSAKILDSDGNVRNWPTQELQFGYRTSRLKSQAAHPESRPVVLEAELELKQAARQELEAKAAEYAEKRRRTQPPGASVGSMFKNPPGDYAGRLVEAAGLKGARVGEAEISSVHANFFVNLGAASAADVYSLASQARKEVAARFGVTLELEIQLVGEW